MKPLIGIDGRLANETQPAGVGRFCTELLAKLPAAAPDFRWRIYLDRPARDGFPSHEAFEFRVLPRRRFWTQRCLAAELRRDSPDLFFSPVMQLPWHCPCPSLVTVHDLAFFAFADQFPWRKRTLMRLHARHVVRNATHLMADSLSTQKDLRNLLKVDSRRITVAPLGCAPQFLQPPSAEAIHVARQQLQLPERFVLYVGRIQPRKNLPRLIEAFARMRERHPELPHHLLIAGSRGWMEGDTYRAAQASPASDHIRFLGYVPADDLPALIAAADALALISLWEGFGLPVIEAMGCGTAVLTSNCSSLPEAAGDAAALVDPCDLEAITAALERLCIDEPYRTDLEQRGQIRATQFSWERTAEKVTQAIRALLNIEVSRA